ncbi:MAG: endonuclease/exonuclease/phosphatase family protein [Thermomicrobiales bacterium]
MPVVRRLHLLLVLAVIALLPWRAAAQEVATPVPVAAPVDVRVMTFNIWVGGQQVGLEQVAAAIQAADADVVGLQEAEGNTRQIADMLNWPYVDERLQVISRLPLIDPPGADGDYTFVQTAPGAIFALANVHLPSDPYGPEAVRDGATADEVLALEAETRLPTMQTVLDRVPELDALSIPLVLTGDFNSPSSLDWTDETAAAREQVKFPLAWPVSEAAFAAGLQDTFRAAHPDPVTRPGLTWTPGDPPGTFRPGETFDRIDWILASGSVETLDSVVVGEPENPDVDIAVAPWPSDHRAVVSTLRLTPATPPLLVAVDARRVTQGDALTVRYHAPGKDGEMLGIVPAGADADALLVALAPRESFINGAETFGTGLLEPGAYEAVLLGADGAVIARAPFTLVAPGAQPTLTVAPEVASGDPITATWTGAPGMKFDWVAIYTAGDPDLGNYWAYLYTGAQIAGSVTFDAEALGDALPPGDYEARLLRDDGYVVLATAPFTVLATP